MERVESGSMPREKRVAVNRAREGGGAWYIVTRRRNVNVNAGLTQPVRSHSHSAGTPILLPASMEPVFPPC